MAIIQTNHYKNRRCYKYDIDIMNMDAEINQLKEQIQSKIHREGFSTLLNTLITQANSALQSNRSSDLNSFDYVVLKLMMIDYLNNNFNRNS